MTEQIIIFFQIILIDLVLAGDNAIIIGMVASQFDVKTKKRIIFWGIGAAIILRIIFTLITAYLLQINGLKAIGGLLLLYIAYKLYKDVIKTEGLDQKKIKTNNKSLVKAIMTIGLVVPFTLSINEESLMAFETRGFPYPVVVFMNSLLLYLLIPIGLAIYNLVKGNIEKPYFQIFFGTKN